MDALTANGGPKSTPNPNKNDFGGVFFQAQSK